VITQDAKSLDRAIAEAQRLGAFFTPRLRAELDETIRSAFADSQARAHVLSGALKASGRSGTDIRDDGQTWIGWQSYGGPGVEQALYEQARGGSHDFFAGTPVYEEAIDQIIRHHDPLSDR
jgi:hypothetical protein